MTCFQMMISNIPCAFHNERLEKLKQFFKNSVRLIKFHNTKRKVMNSRKLIIQIQASQPKSNNIYRTSIGTEENEINPEPNFIKENVVFRNARTSF